MEACVSEAGMRIVICGPCRQGRHSDKGSPEYGESEFCPEERCDCKCRATATLAVGSPEWALAVVDSGLADGGFRTEADNAAVEVLRRHVEAVKTAMKHTTGSDHRCRSDLECRQAIHKALEMAVSR